MNYKIYIKGFLIISSLLILGCEYYDDLEDYSINNNEWFIKFYGGSSIEKGLDAVETNDNGFLLVGSTDSYGNGGDDGYIIKTDRYGNMEWSKIFGGQLNDRATSVSKLGDHFLIVGDTAYDINTTNIILKHIAEDGELIWKANIENDRGGSLRSKKMYITSQDQIVVIGDMESEGNTQMVVSVWDDHQLVWQRYYGYGSVSTTAAAVIESNNGNLVVLGTVDENKMLLVELDEFGGEVKVNFFGGENDVIANDFYQNSLNEFVIMGSFQSGLCLVKVNENFEVVAEDLMQGEQYGTSPLGASISPIENDTLIVSATYQKIFDDGFQIQYFLLSKRIFGQEIWLKAYGDTDNEPDYNRDFEQAATAFKTSDGGIALFGTHDFINADKMMLIKVKGNGEF